ncbi:MAG: 16S rRNA (cytosine(1402)-N(4))-methyltransferase RsmH [Erysipelotrichaceae bacterium]|nr:16S rRNA (cytosine(1402)-N(4))-methyltransferase RsmH [Erysipelotrichaceae bacterium]
MAEHYSVLLKESIDALNIREDGIYVDGTLGRAGHSSEILKRLTTGHLYSFDLDEVAIEQSRPRLAQISDHFTLIHANFEEISRELEKCGVNQVDGMIFDLGVSSPQFDQPERGFSYRYDGPLDMRMDQSQSLNAYTIVNEYPYEQLVQILYRYGEEPFAKQIARNIEKHRALKPIETTFELVDIVKEALPAKVKNKKGHPAKQTFQAIRIAVNHELDALEQMLEQSLKLLKPNGRCAVITFHSLEDRIVKTIFKEVTSAPEIDKRLPITADQLPQADFELITRKPILPSNQELDENRRSHSAKLRVIERKGIKL